MKAVFCILVAMYLFRVAGQIKLKTSKHAAVSGVIYLMSFVSCFVSMALCVYGM